MKNILSLILILAISGSLHAQKVLFLDAGHGGKDIGAVSATGVTEAQLNASFVKELKAAAEAKGIRVVLINEGSKYVPLKDRANKVNNYVLAKESEPLLISIHANYSKDPSKSGLEVFYSNDKELATSKKLATDMADALGAKLIEKRLSLLRSVSIPAILIETGYISNEKDLNNILTIDMRSLIIDKIIRVLE